MDATVEDRLEALEAEVAALKASAASGGTSSGDITAHRVLHNLLSAMGKIYEDATTDLESLATVIAETNVA